MANITLDSSSLLRAMRNDQRRYQVALQAHVERELVRELKRASRNNYRNRTGRLWRTQRRIPGVGARIGSRYRPYWMYIDNFTRGGGRFVTRLLDTPAVRERVMQNAIEATNRQFSAVF